MTSTRLLFLVTRRLNGEIEADELQELERWAAGSVSKAEWLARMTEEYVGGEVRQFRSLDQSAGYARWVSDMRQRRSRLVWRISGWTAAASVMTVLVVVGLGRRKTVARQVVASSAPKPVLPGRNTATLTLGNGRQVLLDSLGNGQLAALQGNMKIVKLDSGSLGYTSTGSGGDEMIAWNTLTTPAAGMYQLILPDHSHVWLNNVSSLRYPTRFSGKDREVELTGEGYFEVARDADRPFVVKVNNGLEVEVLGTSFDIKAYSDEAASQTTLLNGSVRVKAGGSSVRLSSDDEARWTGSGMIEVKKDPQAESVIAWKNGFFYFDRASLKEVMQQLARWYNVDVKYEGAVPEVEFGGKIDRSLPLDDLLKFLQKNQVHFRLQDRTIIVLPS